MSRWKPPAPKSSPYITPEGYVSLQNEFKSLWVRRSEVTSALSAAAAEGDRSENAEYIYRKKELREIDSRIHYLQVRLPVLNIVSDIHDKHRVYFGARVSLEDDNGKKTIVRIVGSDELGSSSENISVDSPLARALLNKMCDDAVDYTIMERTVSFVIRSIQY